MAARPVIAAALAAALFLTPLPASAGFIEAIKQGWKDLKASFRTAPEEAKEEGKETWQDAREGAADAVEKGREAAQRTAEDAKKGWQEVKDAFKSQ